MPQRCMSSLCGWNFAPEFPFEIIPPQRLQTSGPEALDPGNPPDALPYPILICMSRLRAAALRLAARRFSRQPPRAGGADMTSRQRWDAQRCFQGCAPEGMAIKYRLIYLYAGACEYRTTVK